MHDISLKTVTEKDLEFLFQVYASTRMEELAQTGWPLDQQISFLGMQFYAQHQHYQAHYPEASFEIIMAGDTPVGRLYVSRWDTQIRIVDIALLAEFRGQGIGSVIMKKLFEEAEKSGLEISIHVEKNNPSMKWYVNCGFIPVEDKGVYNLMRTKLHGDAVPSLL